MFEGYLILFAVLSVLYFVGIVAWGRAIGGRHQAPLVLGDYGVLLTLALFSSAFTTGAIALITEGLNNV